jgi:hypothetical protein
MQQHRWFCSLLITTLLLSSCQTKELAATNPESQSSLLAKVNPLTISIFTPQANVETEPEVNECLSCHADKDRLIETAKEEEIVESESSGVG